MSTITKERALCMFFYKPYNEENVISLAKILEKENLEICYTDEPTEPVLVHSLSVIHNPFRYRTYICKKILEPTTANKKMCALNSTQIVLLLNTVYLAYDPENSDLYANKTVTMKQIYCTVLNYSDNWDNKNLNSFIKWCSSKKLDFLQVGTKRKIAEGDDKKTTRARSLYVLKDDYLDDVAYKINDYLPSYKNYINKLKEEGHTIIGYIRKSPGKEPDDRRRQLLEAMSLNLKERSLVDVVFASPCSQASDPIESRDKKKHALLDQISVAGSTQDLIKFIASKNKVCLVTLDYAGFSTNCLDLKKFLSKNTQIKKIIVDLFPYTNEMTVYDCKQLLENPGGLRVFDCRKAFYRRSK